MRVSSPRQMVCQPGSPSGLRPRKPPRLARALMNSRTVLIARGRRVIILIAKDTLNLVASALRNVLKWLRRLA